MRTPPGSTVSHHGVEDGQELSHARHQSNLFGFAGCYQSLIECFDQRVVSAGDQRSHVESFTNPRPATPDATPAPEGSRVPVEWGYTDQSGELSRRKRAKLWKLGQKRAAQNRPDSGNAPQESLILLEGGTRFDDLPEVPVHSAKFFLQPLDVGLQARADLLGRGGPQTVLLGDQHPDELPSPGYDRLKLQRLGLGRSFWFGANRLGESGEYRRIYPVRFREPSDRLGEIPHLARVHDCRGNPRSEKRRYQRSFEATRGFEDYKGGFNFAELPGEHLNAILIVGDGKSFSARQSSVRKQGHVQPSLRDIDADMDFVGEVQDISPFPSVGRPSLAGTGSEEGSSSDPGNCSGSAGSL